MTSPPAEFNGLYFHTGVQAVLDDKAALNLGYGYDSGLPGPHGTYTRLPFFWVRTDDITLNGANVEDGELKILDHNGDCCRFIWNGQDAWVSDPSDVLFACAPTTAFPGNASPEVRSPTLILDAYDQSTVPSGSMPGDFYIRPQEPVSSTPQKVRFDKHTGALVWFTDHYPNGLEFKEAKAQPSEKCTDGHGCFGEVFQVQNHGYAQLAFPFCGFKPDALTTSGPQWTGISTPGTGAMYDDGNVDGGDKQDYGGTLVFKFPARNSKDYMASENVDSQPNFPLGFRARADPHTYAQTLSQLISTSHEEMDSWKVGLGFSGGIEKVLNVGLSGTYQNKTNICRESSSRFAVTRKGGVKWVAILDPPNLTLHPDFVEEVESRLDRWMTADPAAREGMDLDWKGFVNLFGTHYLHAMTQGWLEISTQVFSLQAESVAEQQGWDLKLTAKATVEGATGQTQDSLEHSWEQKFGTKVESDTARFLQLGAEAAPIAIFLDLRSLAELFSPVFFRYNPLDDSDSLAPVVWYGLRKSFAKYLEAFPSPTLVNYAPQKFHLRILSITHKVTLKDFGQTIYTYATGPVNVAPDSREGAPYANHFGITGNMSLHNNCVNDTGFHPDESFFAAITIERAYTGPVKLCVETVFSLTVMGRTGPSLSRKYYVSFDQGSGAATASDEFFDIALAFGPALA